MRKDCLIMTRINIGLALVLGALLLAGGLASGGCNAARPSIGANASEDSATDSPDEHPDTDSDAPEDEDDAGVEEFPLYINAQIDAELEDTAGLSRIVAALQDRNLTTTIYVTAEYARNHQWSVHDFFLDGFEIALHGYSSGEDLTGMDYDDQRDLLTQERQVQCPEDEQQRASGALSAG